MDRLKFGPKLTSGEQQEITAELKALREKFDAGAPKKNPVQPKEKSRIVKLPDTREQRAERHQKVLAEYRTSQEAKAEKRAQMGVRNRLIGPHAAPRKLNDGDPTQLVTTRNVRREHLPPLATNRVENPSIISDEYVNEGIDAAHDAVNARNGLPNNDLRVYLRENFPKAVAKSFRKSRNVAFDAWKQGEREKLEHQIGAEWQTEESPVDLPREKREPVAEELATEPGRALEAGRIDDSESKPDAKPEGTVRERKSFEAEDGENGYIPEKDGTMKLRRAILYSAPRMARRAWIKGKHKLRQSAEVNDEPIVNNNPPQDTDLDDALKGDFGWVAAWRNREGGDADIRKEAARDALNEMKLEKGSWAAVRALSKEDQDRVIANAEAKEGIALAEIERFQKLSPMEKMGERVWRSIRNLW